MSLPLIGVFLDPGLSIFLQLGLILLATLASEDLTCIAVGLLIRAGEMHLVVGLTGCFVGIFAGDLGLWLVGRLTAIGLVHVPFANRWLERLPHSGKDPAPLLARRGWWAVLASRFLPGTRLPLYLVAGAVGGNFAWFALWTALACLLWTPLIVLGAMVLGEGVLEPLRFLATALVLFVILRIALRTFTATNRARLLAAISRAWQPEFWPAWLFYLPLVPWLVWLSVRYRGMLIFSAANPGIPHGGVVGESKYAILMQLPPESIVPSFLVRPGAISSRLEQVRTALAEKGWTFPLILKPDAAQRGAGVKRIDDFTDVEKYLHQQPAAVLVQPWHPGPHEVGIFYNRLPGAETGRIFSITDKVFPVLEGDGRATLEELIWRHPRYRMQARVFLARYAADRQRILAEGERLVLALAGNHCQGTLFRDGAHLITPDLERAVDGIAQHFPGFFIGRFDVRYPDPASLAAGRNLAIVELNGATSESTNLYDPSWSLWSAYRTLFRQWSLLYRIGAANRKRGHVASSPLALFRLVRRYYGERRVDSLAD
jgi:membrane protein DedA with SNARE-associated domain